MMTKMFKYPEVVHSHFQNHHSVNDHNVKRHSPITIEVVWATKQWPNCVFVFLFVITEVNCFLLESHFRKHHSMMDNRKELANALIENQYLVQKELAEKQRSARIWQEIGHGLVLLPLFQKSSEEQMVKFTSQYPPKKGIHCNNNS